MRNLLLIASILTSFIFVNAQDFSFQLDFTDNVGYTDSLVFGYDPLASDSIDIQFNEINIVDTDLNPDFDVRFSDFLQMKPLPLSYQTKRQITTKNNFAYWKTISTIEIFCKNWPVTASWDSTLFNNATYNGSLLTAAYPGGWFDASAHSSNLNVKYLKNSSKVTFTKNYNNGIYFIEIKSNNKVLLQSKFLKISP